MGSSGSTKLTTTWRSSRTTLTLAVVAEHRLREGLNRLMADVEAKRINFTALLVYDVSRWGRFQDVDESAYYEYVLKRSGIRVHYCAEQFENDGACPHRCSRL